MAEKKFKQIESLKLGYFGKEITFSGGIKVKFDSKGVGEVPEESYDDLLVEYSDFICPVGGRKAKNEEKVEQELAGNEKAKELALEVEKQKGFVKNKEEKIKTLETEVTNWKGKVDELLTEKETLTNGDLSQKQEEIDSLTKQNEDLTFEIELWKQNVPSLKKALGDLGMDEGKFKEEKDKEVLVKMIVEGTKK